MRLGRPRSQPRRGRAPRELHGVERHADLELEVAQRAGERAERAGAAMGLVSLVVERADPGFHNGAADGGVGPMNATSSTTRGADAASTGMNSFPFEIRYRHGNKPQK